MASLNRNSVVAVHNEYLVGVWQTGDEASDVEEQADVKSTSAHRKRKQDKDGTAANKRQRQDAEAVSP